MTTEQTSLRQAYGAWMSCASLRASRRRNKRFTYGDQWGDVRIGPHGQTATDGELLESSGHTPITNNLIRHLVRTVVGRFRAQEMGRANKQSVAAGDWLATVGADNNLDELDSRALEEFLISGCCVQRVEPDNHIESTCAVEVTNVNLNRFFTGPFSDPCARDCELVGQLHDLPVGELMRRVSGGVRRRAAWVRRLYSEQTGARVAEMRSVIGADNQSGTSFWQAAEPGLCRAIEVWTRERREVVVCHRLDTAELMVVPVAEARTLRESATTRLRWDVAARWHCRWFSPMGDLLTEYDSPWQHNRHPFAMKFYPLTDGEVHSLVEDVIDQQKFVNRLITMVDRVMACSAKGVLLYPETLLPDGYTWQDIQRIWTAVGGILPYSPHCGDGRPEQIAVNNTNIGAYEMIQLQMRLLENVSGVSGVLQGRDDAGGTSATLFERQLQAADASLTDIYDSFSSFRQARNRLINALNSTPQRKG